MRQRVLILGCSGMLGHKLLSQLSELDSFDVYATARSTDGLPKWCSPEIVKKIRIGVDANNFETVGLAIDELRPEIVINCIGLIKQLPSASDPIPAITINSLLPHQISVACRGASARMIHISTDCVFNGKKGGYTESDPSDATDLYGRSKFLGEVDGPGCVTLRTSIIGHELKGGFGLIEWFIAQRGRVRGYVDAMYTGFTTCELAKIIAEYVIPNERLCGVYNVSSDLISKYELLKLVAEIYQKKIEIVRHGGAGVDRSLDSTRFRSVTNYAPPSWPEMIEFMHRDYLNSECYR